MAKAKAKPKGYKIVTISIYDEDNERLACTVARLKREGYTKASKSWLIRQALRLLDTSKLPPPDLY